MDIIVSIAKCLVVGIIWAALLIPVIFQRGSALKYIACVLVIALISFFFPGYRGLILAMTLIALVALILSWIVSMAVFDKDSKVKAKVISFACVISGFSYLIYVLFISGNVHVTF